MTVLMGLRAQLRLARLQLVTDIRTRQGDWPQFVRTVFDNGVDILQVHDTEADRHDLLAALETARAIAFDHRRLVAVGGAPALAARFGADVLHLGAADGPVAENRRGLPEASLVGRSVHSGAQLRDALRDPAVDYLFVGPSFATSGVRQVPGLDLVREAAGQAVPSERDARPWFADGGITVDTLQQVLDAGARRIAVAEAVNDASDPGAVVAALSRSLHEVWDADPALQSYRLHGFGNPGVATFRD